MTDHLLSLLIFLPLVGAMGLLCVPARFKDWIRALAFLVTAFTLALAAMCFIKISGSGDFELVELISWIAPIGANYHVGVDGASALLVILTALLSNFAVIVSWREINERVKEFHCLLLVLETGLLGVFSSLDMLLFFVFWELVLVPMYFIIGVWGGGQRVQAAFKFIIFTAVGSAPLLAVVIYSSVIAGSFDLAEWHRYNFNRNEQIWLFAGLALAFGVKTPLLGLHSWLPPAHTEAPTAGSVLLAGVLLKMGGYGFYRFAIPVFPAGFEAFRTPLLILAVAGIIVGALLALAQRDLKRLIAYSSISHMGFVVLGLAALERMAAAGAVLQMFAHGIVTGLLFMLMGMLYSRSGRRMVADNSGTLKLLPQLSVFFIFAMLACIGLPGLANFPSEFLIMLGSFQTQTLYAAISIGGVLLMTACMLWTARRVFFGVPANGDGARMPDLRFREYAALIPAAVLIIAIGVWPEGFLKKEWRSADAFVKLAERVEVVSAAPSQ